MVFTIRNLTRSVVALAILALAGSDAAGGAPRLTTPSGPISVNASSTRIDYKTQHVHLRNVVISRGKLRVSAERADATGLNFKDSRWTFAGNVHISSAERGNLTSDTATVEFRNERMQTAQASGSPAVFQETASKSGVLARGHADSIVYAVAAGTVRLEGHAWLKYGENEITGPLLVYDIVSQKLEGVSAVGRGGRVHITIQPKERASEHQGGKAPSTAPVGGASDSRAPRPESSP